MKIFQQIKQSVYSPSYYHTILESKPLSSSLKYFFKYALILAIATSIIVSVTVLPFLPKLIKGLIADATVSYPDELVITIDHGKASTNMTEPILFPLENKDQEESPNNFLVIDTKTPFTVEEYESYDTFALLTSDSIISGTKGSQIRITPLSNIGNQVITKGLVVIWGEKAEKFIPILIPIVIFGSLLVSFIIYASYLLYTILFALLALLLLSLMKVRVTYKKAYQIGLHAITLSILINLLNFIPHIQIHVRFLFTIIGLLILYLNFRNYATDKSPELNQTAPQLGK